MHIHYSYPPVLPSFPLNLAPASTGASSPILLEKKGLILCEPKFANRSEFSRKNCLFSGKEKFKPVKVGYLLIHLCLGKIGVIGQIKV
jgi:hypothetical protein